MNLFSVGDLESWVYILVRVVGRRDIVFKCKLRYRFVLWVVVGFEAMI